MSEDTARTIAVVIACGGIAVAAVRGYTRAVQWLERREQRETRHDEMLAAQLDTIQGLSQMLTAYMAEMPRPAEIVTRSILADELAPLRSRVSQWSEPS